MGDIQKLCLPPLFTHSIDYDNNLTIYECYGALLHYLNNVLLKDLNDLKAIIQNIIEVNNQQEIKIENNKVNIELNTIAIQDLKDLIDSLDLESLIARVGVLENELLGVNSIVDDIRGVE